uniref:IQ motif containing with AAA domain 1 n=1 Tax=Astyanax mexicanus TaxID=7994 RepID=A0A8B9L5V4_ASTMX
HCPPLCSSYSRIWAEAQGALADLLEDEIPPTSLRPQKDRFQAFHTLATFYLRYLHIFRRLEEVYDQIVHPQKRQVVRQVLEGVMGRLVELKNEMVELEFSEFHYLDDLLQDLKMTPEDLDVPIPRYFIRERMKALKERERMLAHILDKKGSLNQEPVSIIEAVQLLQVSERARQGRLRAHFMKEIWREERRIRQGEDGPTEADLNLAATLIQRNVDVVWVINIDATGKFPDFPSAEDGGSASIFSQKSPEEVRTTQTLTFFFFFPVLFSAVFREFIVSLLSEVQCVDVSVAEVWQTRDEGQNFPQRFDPQLVREEKRMEVEEEVRVQVRVGKFSLSLSLFVSLSLYLGEYSYLGTSLRQANIEPMPSLSDVRQLIALYGVLPLGSQSVHERGPLIRSLLLAGPSGVGKKMLLHALCTETGANLFNLSPGNLAGKYPGKSGLQYLLHMVLKVARQLQPSVLWIGDAEKTFYKKVPKAEKELEPKRLKKDLVKVVKSIKVEDRVLLVGTSRRPFDADLKSLSKVYKKIILIPRPDYSSRLSEYKTFMNLIISIFKKVTFFLFLSIYTPKSRVTHKPI